MTTPSESPTHDVTDAPLPHPPWTSAPKPRTVRPAWIILAVVGVLVLMAGTGVGVWLLTRQPATGTLTVTGEVTLKRGQFALNGASSDSKCEGLQGYAEFRTGTQVTVTDAAGKVLAVGALDLGATRGITDETKSCVLPFKVPGIRRGVGPYGVEVGHRGVLRYNEEDLDAIQLQL